MPHKELQEAKGKNTQELYSWQVQCVHGERGQGCSHPVTTTKAHPTLPPPAQ